MACDEARAGRCESTDAVAGSDAELGRLVGFNKQPPAGGLQKALPVR